MLKLSRLIKTKQNQIAQHLLNTVDSVGATLNQLGMKNKINRHTLIGQLWVQKYRLEGEKDRLDLLMYNSMRPIKKMRSQFDKSIDDAIERLPAPLAKRAHRTHEQLRRLSGG